MDKEQVISMQEFKESCLKLGIKKGDILFVHSSYKNLGKVEGGPLSIIKALLEILTDEGTLIMPTFNFNFCEDYNAKGEGIFDIEKTPSKMGIITELFRRMRGVKRSHIPIYSIAVKGKYENEFVNISDKKVFGTDSVFGKLHKMNGKILFIAVSYQDSWTFAHYIENLFGVDYRYPKTFKGKIIYNGKESNIEVEMLVRDLERNVVTNVQPMGELLEKLGAVESINLGKSFLKLMDCTKSVDFTIQEMKKNPTILYKIEKKI
jgi:aminoglycoside 3-N-acetyltransferase